MSDARQDTFDGAEAIADALHAMAGCEDALLSVLDEPLARWPDQGRAVYGVLAAIRMFRERAAAEAQRIARMQGGLTSTAGSGTVAHH
jgi:hypothetical protein